MGGVHRICIKAHKTIFKEVPSIKYEMSIQIEGLFEAQYESREEVEKLDSESGSA